MFHSRIKHWQLTILTIFVIVTTIGWSLTWPWVGVALATSYLPPQSVTYPAYTDVDIDKQVEVSGDDGYSSDAWGGSFNTIGDYTFVGHSSDAGSTYMAGWHRFNNVTIPAGATLNVATLSYWGYNYGSGNPSTLIFAEDAANPAAPTSRADHVSRVRTTASIEKDGLLTYGAWNNFDILTILNELYGDYDYSSGAAIQILHDNDGSPDSTYLEAAQWDYLDNTYGAKLHIEYSTAPVVGLPLIMIVAGFITIVMVYRGIYGN